MSINENNSTSLMVLSIDLKLQAFLWKRIFFFLVQIFLWRYTLGRVKANFGPNIVGQRSFFPFSLQMLDFVLILSAVHQFIP